MFGIKSQLVKALEAEVSYLKEQNKDLLDKLLAFNERAYWTHKGGTQEAPVREMYKDPETGIEKPMDMAMAEAFNQVLGE